MKRILWTLYKWGLLGICVYGIMRVVSYAVDGRPYLWWHGIMDLVAIIIIVAIMRLTRRWMGLES